MRFRICGEGISDVSDSSGTLFMDNASRDWSDPILEAASLSIDQMPRLVEGIDFGGTLRSDLARDWGIKTTPIIGGGGGDNAVGAIALEQLNLGIHLFHLEPLEYIL